MSKQELGAFEPDRRKKQERREEKGKQEKRRGNGVKHKRDEVLE